MGKIKLVEVTSHERGWKGTWYKTGQRHFVRQHPRWPQVMACKWDAGPSGVPGGIHEHHCRVVGGFSAYLKCAFQSLVLWFKARGGQGGGDD